MEYINGFLHRLLAFPIYSVVFATSAWKFLEGVGPFHLALREPEGDLVNLNRLKYH